MKEVVLLFFFTFCFLFIVWTFSYFLLFNRRIQKRINYYFYLNKTDTNFKKNRDGVKEGISSLKKLNELIRKKLSNIDQDKIDQMLKSAGVLLTPEEYVMLKWFLSAITGGILYFLSSNVYLLIPGSIIGYTLPKIWINRKIKIRILKFNEGLPDMIATLISSLKSGYSFAQALKTVAEECDSPIKEEATLLLKEMNYGITMEEALNNLGKRMPSDDLELMLQAILIQRQVGGNLAGVLEIIVKTIRERTRIQRQVQSLTAQGRLSGRIIGALPIALGLMIYFMNPEYIKVLFNNTLGIIILSAGIISGIIGFILIHKLTKVEV
ncbi:type II secretion system F family protein [Clostridium ganghwense]|uniref:Type II secretion system F family protein n=1 Tax=Clostridium ganghwense TaxID=312089 RepID=A0ABT4CQ41_9CLOT|nr:type II secretion system F family protein [Clostridium ganghwense]MCY6371183.1 type II secretion system F family protein [Clostridium ganghwense]